MRHLPDKFATFRARAVSQSLRHFAAPPAALVQREYLALAPLHAAPMHAIALAALRGLGGCKSPHHFVLGPTQLEDASLRFAQTDDILLDLADARAALRSGDVESSCILRRALGIRRQANSIPPYICDHPRPQLPPVRGWLTNRAQPALDQWLNWRLSHLLERRVVRLSRLRLCELPPTHGRAVCGWRSEPRHAYPGATR